MLGNAAAAPKRRTDGSRSFVYIRGELPDLAGFMLADVAHILSQDRAALSGLPIRKLRA